MSAEIVVGKAGADRIERVITSGTFELDGGSWDVDNNVWLIGNDEDVIIVDPAHEAAPIKDAIGDRTVVAILCTHAHNDHIGAAKDLREASRAKVYLHPDDRVLWDMSQDWAPDVDIAPGDEYSVGDLTLRVLHTPGHAPGACCFYVPELSALLTGDTLFQGGPGATGRSYSDKSTLVESIHTRLFALPGETVVLTGHGDSTTLEAEKKNVTND